MKLVSSFWGLAILTVFLPIAFLLAVLISVQIISGTVMQRLVCGENMQEVGIAMKVYLNDYDGHYPPSEKWCDLLIKEADVSPDRFQCPLDPKGAFSYAINKNLYVIEPNEITPSMVMLFEADLGRDSIGGPEDLVLRHEQNGKRGCNIAFVDGHLEFITEDRIADLQWTVE